MFATRSNRYRNVLTVIALCAELAHLGWEYTHGGVLVHHLLANPDLPGISNWWGLLVIPVLTWWLAGRIDVRVQASRRGMGRSGMPPWVGFVGALLYGAALATAFALGSPLVDWLFFALPVLGVVLRAWRAEFVLGFILGMTFVFGAVLPTLMATVVAALSRGLHLLGGWIWRWLRPGRDLA